MHAWEIGRSFLAHHIGPALKWAGPVLKWVAPSLGGFLAGFFVYKPLLRRQKSAQEYVKFRAAFYRKITELQLISRCSVDLFRDPELLPGEIDAVVDWFYVYANEQVAMPVLKAFESRAELIGERQSARTTIQLLSKLPGSKASTKNKVAAINEFYASFGDYLAVAILDREELKKSMLLVSEEFLLIEFGQTHGRILQALELSQKIDGKLAEVAGVRQNFAELRAAMEARRSTGALGSERLNSEA